MSQIEYQPFSDFYNVVRPLAAPEDLGQELIPFFRDQIGNALADIQTLIPWLREFNVDFYHKNDVEEFCDASIFAGHVGKPVQLFAFKPGVDCKRYHYKRVQTSAIDCWMERQRCTTCAPTVPAQPFVYDSPYCNYVVPGDTGCNPPYLPSSPEDDRGFKCLDDDARIFAIGPDYRVFAAPRFPCDYVLCFQWQGIRRKWNNTDMVPVDQQVREAVVNYVEHKVALKERDRVAAGDYMAEYMMNLRTLKYRFHDEQDAERKKDCSAALEQLLPSFQPLYFTPVYSGV